MIKLYSSTPMNDLAIDEINKNFIKKTVKEQITQNAIELLEKDMVICVLQFKLTMILNYRKNIIA